MIPKAHSSGLSDPEWNSRFFPFRRERSLQLSPNGKECSDTNLRPSLHDPYTYPTDDLRRAPVPDRATPLHSSPAALQKADGPSQNVIRLSSSFRPNNSHHKQNLYSRSQYPSTILPISARAMMYRLSSRGPIVPAEQLPHCPDAPRLTAHFLMSSADGIPT